MPKFHAPRILPPAGAGDRDGHRDAAGSGTSKAAVRTGPPDGGTTGA
jgi:hypothetical protein